MENQYLTWSEYKTLGGELPQNAFNLLEYEARKKIDEMTFGRLKDLESQIQDVRMCVFKLIDVVNENKSTVKSESVDGYSITMDTKTTEEQDIELNDIVFSYLVNCRLDNGTPYLYRGI